MQHLNAANDYAGEPDRQTGSLAGLAVTLLLIVVGLYLVDALRAQADFQDCVMSGHAACPSFRSDAAGIVDPTWQAAGVGGLAR